MVMYLLSWEATPVIDTWATTEAQVVDGWVQNLHVQMHEVVPCALMYKGWTRHLTSYSFKWLERCRGARWSLKVCSTLLNVLCWHVNFGRDQQLGLWGHLEATSPTVTEFIIHVHRTAANIVTVTELPASGNWFTAVCNDTPAAFPHKYFIPTVLTRQADLPSRLYHTPLMMTHTCCSHMYRMVTEVLHGIQWYKV